MKKNTLIALTALITLGVNAQKGDKNLTEANQVSLEKEGVIRCYTVENENMLQQKHANRASIEAFEAALAVEIEKRKNSASSQRGGVRTIPVVYHIFTDGVGADNISQALVNAQNDQLNIDFRNMDSSPFPAAGDSQIEFCMAQQDPNGNNMAEVGINRITTYGDGPFGQADFENGMKAATQWDPTRYLNIWVAPLGNNLLGYAQFPSGSGLAGMPANGGAANTDGVVILTNSAGSEAMPNPNGGVFGAGRTLTHEIGHWLGLRHIWGDANCGDDFCNDTPTQQTNSTGCPNTTTCDGNQDLTSNYMDYSNDTCMNNFTVDQSTRMNTVLDVCVRRMELVTTSNACQQGVIYNLDGSIEINDLGLISCGNTISPQITITNRGISNLTSADIEYSIDNGVSSTYNWTGSLAMNASSMVTLPTQTLAGGAHTLDVSLTNPNGGTDENIPNNSDGENFNINAYDTTTITLNLIPDDYGSETTWEFRDGSNTVIASGGPYTNNDSTPINQTFNVSPTECYTFIINDQYGDGICCDWGVGSYSLTTGNGDLIFAGAEFTDSETTSILVASLSTEEFFTVSGVSLYPNPTNGVLNIKVNNGNTLPDGYAIYNVLGQTITQKQVNIESDLTVNTSELSNGMYFIRITKDGGAISLPFIKE